MKLGLLGADEEVLRLLRVVARSPEHQVALLCEVGPWLAELQQLFPTAQVAGEVADLLFHPTLGAILVNSRPFDSAREDQLRRLVQSASCVILTHPAAQHLLALELEMIRVESGAVILTYVPDWLDFPDELVGVNGEGPWQGTSQPVDQIVWDRGTPDGTPREIVWRQLSRDLLQMRQWMGAFRQVSAIASDATEGSRLARTTVMSKNEAGEVARWSAQGLREVDAAQLVLKSGTDSWTLAQTPGQTWRRTDAPGPITGGQNDTRCLRLLAAWDQARQSHVAPVPWETVCQALVMVDGVEYSLTRGKPVDLRNDLVTEEDSFKGVMAAGGCLILMAVLCLLFAMSLLDALRLPIMSVPYVRHWPVALAVVLLLFLLLQTLRWIVYRRPSSPD